MMFGSHPSAVHVLSGLWARSTMAVAGVLLIVGGLGAEALSLFTGSIRFAL